MYQFPLDAVTKTYTLHGFKQWDSFSPQFWSPELHSQGVGMAGTLHGLLLGLAQALGVPGNWYLRLSLQSLPLSSHSLLSPCLFFCL